MSIPIWVTDPTGNNNPFLKIVTPALFVVWMAGGTMWWSSDGLTWTSVTTPATGLPGLAGGTLAYNQGMWAAQFEYDSGFGWMSTTNGKDWTLAVKSSDGASFAETYEQANNRWKFTLLEAPNTVTFVNNPNPLDGDGNFTLFANPIAAVPFMTLTPTQPAAANHSTLVLKNALPSTQTGVRYLFDIDATKTFEYTSDSITDTIVDSGSGWPAANWTTSAGWESGPAVDSGLVSFGKTQSS